MHNDNKSQTPILQQWTTSLTGWSAARPTFQSRSEVTRLLLLVAATLLSALLLGRSNLTAPGVRDQQIGAIVGMWRFDLVRWEVDAIAEKVVDFVRRPAAGLSREEDVALVTRYIEDAAQLGQLERQINALLSVDGSQSEDEVAVLQAQIDTLRAGQQERRPLVESIIQSQVAAELADAGFHVGTGPFPPVWFTFVEPPKKLVVSPRSRIATVYSRMLSEEIALSEIESNEAAIADATGLSAYITNIGGLGAYPTMVIDRASLSWIFNTVAHEWAHNYLTLFPLGLRYNVSGDLITINETVAEIVGDEIGRRVVARYYPDFLPAEEVRAERTGPESGEDTPEPFNFSREMRETRLRVDKLLAAGAVETAERYMEARRQYFVANGYPLRVLNQAYFAFHGSYGTSAASTSPIGPQLEALRDRSEDLADFLRTVRWFTGADDIESALNN